MSTAPQNDYRVELDAYSGPLDLLLYLVKREEIDLHDIPIARLTEQYLQHLQLLQQIDIDLAGDFLVMAATLLEIKSAMLVPSAASASEDPAQAPASVIDPRLELVQQLLAYKRFKDAANDLEDRYEQWSRRFAHLPVAPQRSAAETDEPTDAGELEIDLEDAHVLDLCEAFARILETVGQGPRAHEVVYDDTPISLHAEDIVDRLQREGAMTLQQIFVGRKTRAEMIGLFLATLELTRQRRIRIVQDKLAGEIRVELRPPEESQEDRATDWRDPVTGEIQYDWPSEEARLRAERRAKLRAKRARGQLTAEEQIEADAIISDDDPPPAANEAQLAPGH